MPPDELSSSVAGGSGQLLPSVSEIIERAANTAFGRPLLTNVVRSVVVEAIVNEAIGSRWRWCAQDYSPHDFEEPGGMRLEVKQSAALQSWGTVNGKASACSWDIAPRTGFWIGPTWAAKPGRNAEIYVLGHHPLTSQDADHRDACQWVFFVICAHDLPSTKRLSLSRARTLVAPIPFYKLHDEVELAQRRCLAERCGAGLKPPQ